MSAQRAPRESETAEIFYVVVPPAAPAKSPSFGQRLHYAVWLMGESEAYGELSKVALAIIGAIGFAVLCCIGLYGLYYLKSILGIDLFADKHFEDFVPLPGYRRW